MRLLRPIAQENRKGRGAAYPHRGSRAWRLVCCDSPLRGE